MTRGLLGQDMERVACVSKVWAGDTNVPASFRHMSDHLYRLATEARRMKQPGSASIRNVGSLFCSICHRIKASPCDCKARSFEQCSVLENVALAGGRARHFNLGWSSPLPASPPSSNAEPSPDAGNPVSDGTVPGVG